MTSHKQIQDARWISQSNKGYFNQQKEFTNEEVDRLLNAYLGETDDGHPFLSCKWSVGLLAMFGRTRSSLQKAIWRLAIHSPDRATLHNYTPTEIRQERKIETRLSNRDNYIIAIALSARGRINGASSLPYLSKILGYPKDQIKKKFLQLAQKQVEGFLVRPKLIEHTKICNHVYNYTMKLRTYSAAENEWSEK